MICFVNDFEMGGLVPEWIFPYDLYTIELKMTNSELTNDFVLEITDFADVADVADMRELWDSQVETLRRTCGF